MGKEKTESSAFEIFLEKKKTKKKKKKKKTELLKGFFDWLGQDNIFFLSERLREGKD